MNFSKISLLFATILMACYALPLLDIAEDDASLITTESYITTSEASPEVEAATENTQTTIEPEEEHSETPLITSTTTTEQPLGGEHVSGQIIVVAELEIVPETDLCYWEGDLWVCLPSSQTLVIDQELLP